MRLRHVAFLLLCVLPVTAGASEPFALYRQIQATIDAWHPEQGLLLLEQLQKIAPDAPETEMAAARLAFELGDYSDAARHMEQFLTLIGDDNRYGDLLELYRETARRTDGMQTLRSRRFLIHFQPGLDEIIAPFAAETLERQLDALQQDLGYHIPEAALPIRVEIYPKVLDFVAVSTLTEKEVQTSGTVALCKFNRLMIVSPRRMARGYKWRDTLGHELVHYVLSRMTRNRAPLWLHEGVAKFEERRWRSERIGDLHPIQESILAEARRKNAWVPFNEMMPSLAKLDSGWKTSLAFAEVTLLVRQIVVDGGMPRLRAAIEAFSESPEAGYRFLGVSTLDELWQQFLERVASETFNPVPGYRFIPPSVAEDPDQAEPEPVEEREGRKYVRIGDLLRREGHWSAALTEYTKAVEAIGHKPAPVSLRIAEALITGGRYPEAERELLDLLVRDPDRATAHWLLGRIALLRGDTATAMQRYETAFAIAPFHREVLAGLVEAAEKLGDRDRLKRYRKALERFDELNS